MGKKKGSASALNRLSESPKPTYDFDKPSPDDAWADWGKQPPAAKSSLDSPVLNALYSSTKEQDAPQSKLKQETKWGKWDFGRPDTPEPETPPAPPPDPDPTPAREPAVKVVPQAAVAPTPVVPIPQSSDAPLRSPRSPRSFPNVEAPHLYSPPQRFRRSSMYSNRTSMSPQAHPPLPHHPQAHFYGTPNLDLGVVGNVSNKVRPGENGCVYKHDSIVTINSKGRNQTEDLVLSGWPGGLDIYRLRKGRVDLIGRLTGIRGLVIDAKIIPRSLAPEQNGVRQLLICLVVHGPRLRSDALAESERKSTTGLSILDEDNKGKSVPPETEPAVVLDEYVTTVELHSLESDQQEAVLYSTQPVQTPVSIDSPLFEPPEPIGQMSVQVAGHFITVTSGESGEVFLYRISPESGQSSAHITSQVTCIGKTWTTVLRRHQKDNSRTSSSTDLKSSKSHSHEEAKFTGLPLLSLSERWLAYSPPVPSASFAQGWVPLAGTQPKVPGLSSHRAPLQPSINCDLESPDNEGMMDWMARGVTQEVIKGAKWVGEQAAKSFNAYWNPSAGTEVSGTSDDRTRGLNSQFPPTHAFANQSTPGAHAPALVSFIDLEKLSKATASESAILPTATFSAPHGCGFLSFSPNGLYILIANGKGDVQTVWNLMRLSSGRIYNPSTKSNSHSLKATVRQVARFTRMTVAVFVDAVWMKPSGEKIALVTDRGTVHIYDLPASASQWPPSRKKIRRVPGEAGSSSTSTTETRSFSASSAASNAVSVVGAAFRFVNSTAQPILSGNHPAQSSSGQTNPKDRRFSALGNYRPPRSQTVAQGFSKSLGAATGTVSSIRNAGENKIHVPLSGGDVKPGSVSWLSGRLSGCIAILGPEAGKIHKVGYRILDKRGDKRRVVVTKNTTPFKLPALPDLRFPPMVTETLKWEQKAADDLHMRFWNLRLRPALAGTDERVSIQMHAEINPSAPYLPFHTDRRVDIFSFEKFDKSMDPNVMSVFGEDIPTIKLDFGFYSEEDSDGAPTDLTVSTENAKVTGSDDETQEQIVITTRKRKPKTQSGNLAGDGLGTTTVEEGFFEDDLEILDFAGERV